VVRASSPEKTTVEKTTMKFIAIAVLFVCPLLAQATEPAGFIALEKNAAEKSDGRTFYRWSLAAVTAANTADSISSWHRIEANPLLATPGSQFDTKSLMLKSALLGVTILVEHWALRHSPTLYRTFAWVNLTIAGALGGVVAHNASLQ
jgi:hypothetical protein